MEASDLEGVIATELERLGFECVKLEILGSSRRPVVRLYIDKPGGVSIKDCGLASRNIGLVLDEIDPFPGRYLLEVSSPGNNRPLVTARHFDRFKGYNARVQCLDGEKGKKTYTGYIQSCINDMLTLETDSGEEMIKVSDIIKANLVGVEYKIDKKIKHSKRDKGGR